MCNTFPTYFFFLQYMLHYLRSLQTWVNEDDWRKLPIARVAAGFLHDFHHDPSILDYKPQHIAIACISLAMQIYGTSVPLSDEIDDSTMWYAVSKLCY